MNATDGLNSLKKHIFYELMGLAGRVFILIKYSEGVVIGRRGFTPEEKKDGLVLVFNRRMNFSWDEEGIAVNLVFGNSPQKCYIPADAITAVYSPDINAQFVVSSQPPKTFVQEQAVEKGGGASSSEKGTSSSDSKTVIKVDFTKKKRTSLLFSMLLSILIPLSSNADNVKDCDYLIRAGQTESVIMDSKVILRQDSWNADAASCLVMAYYADNNKYMAFKQWKEAEDGLPKELLDKIHDNVWNYLPELLAEKEHRDNYTTTGGDCILRNITALKGDGYVVIGSFSNPFNSNQNRHLAGYKCSIIESPDNCAAIDLVCPECKLIEPEIEVAISGYSISGIRRLKDAINLSRNLQYIKKILELEAIRHK
ncbi:MAG: ClpXP protease specificity-enhancing factor SspB [Nitrospirae bacterium]|nr:ClpXP protease specificity-enhancing factor SspB [Nitrospirota bacterium]